MVKGISIAYNFIEALVIIDQWNHFGEKGTFAQKRADYLI